jgi:hypothetical protein
MRRLQLICFVSVLTTFLATATALAQQPITRIGPTSDGNSTSLTFITPLGTQTLDAGRNVGDVNTSSDPDCSDDLRLAYRPLGTSTRVARRRDLHTRLGVGAQ